MNAGDRAGNSYPFCRCIAASSDSSWNRGRLTAVGSKSPKLREGQSRNMGIGEVGELLRRATVHIRCAGSSRASMGSGVIWSSDGTVITNAHVAGSGPHSVELWDGRSFTAPVMERDSQRDLAKLKIPAGALTAAKFRAAPVRNGERVIRSRESSRIHGSDLHRRSACRRTDRRFGAEAMGPSGGQARTRKLRGTTGG